MLNPLEMEAFIQAIASRTDMRVVWEKGIESPRTDGKTIWLPHITAGMTEDKYATLKHYVAHEVDHVRFTDFKSLANQPNCTEGILGAIINMVEDLRVEKKGSEEFLGDRLNSGNVQSKRLYEIGERLPERLKKGGRDTAMLETVAPLLEWSHKHWANIYPAVSGSARLFKEACVSNPVAKEYMEKYAKGDYDKCVKGLTSAQETVELADRICREVYGVDPDKERKKMKDARKAKSKKQEDAKSGEKEGGKEEGADKEQESGKKGVTKKSVPRDKEVTVDYSSAMLDPHDTTGESRHAMHIVYKDSEFSSGVYSPAKAEDYYVRTRNELTIDSGAHSVTTERLDSMKSILRKTNPNFAHRVRTVLQVRAKDKLQYGLKRGALNQSALHRLIVNVPHYADRVFKKRITSDVLDACVFLLVDQSGSMGTTKFNNAAVAAAMMNEVVGNALHIPTYIASFTDHSMSPSGNGELSCIFVHREWKDQLLNNDKLLSSFAMAACKGMFNNADGDSLMWAFNKTIQQKQKRKLIIVFSDGQPSGGRRGDAPWYAKRVASCIEKQSPVDLVGIGICDSNVKRIYKEHYVINNVHDLEKALLSTIEGKLK